MAFNLDDLLAKSYKKNASDVHLNCDKVPALRINGEIYKVAGDPVTYEDIETILAKTLPEVYQEERKDLQNIDYIYDLKGIARYRVNYCKDIFHGKLTFRSIPYHIKTLEELALPETLKEYTKFNNGIVIVTGATGSGKSTTLSSLIEIINQTRKDHIVTIEDPVEFVYEDKKSIITQRSLDVDVGTFKSGIKYALRQDPDVILVGEIRDRDTLLSAIEAAETGHLVFSTLHTNGTIASIDRLVGFVEESGQDAFRKRLAHCIRGVVHQQLVPKEETGELIPALEILTCTSTVVDYIEKGDFEEIYGLMKRSTKPNLRTMNASLFELYEKRIISRETAMEYSLEKIEMSHLMKGISRGTSVDDLIF